MLSAGAYEAETDNEQVPNLVTSKESRGLQGRSLSSHIFQGGLWSSRDRCGGLTYQSFPHFVVQIAAESIVSSL